MPFDGSIRRPRLRRFLLALARRLLRIEVSGLENVPAPPYLLACNHLSILDGALVSLLAPDPTVLLVAARFARRPWLRPLLETYAGVIPLELGEASQLALDAVVETLGRGLPVVMSPEGHVSPDGRLRQARRGVARLAVAAGVPVVPMAWWGHEKFWRDYLRLRRPYLRMVIGPPLSIGAECDPLEGADRVMRQIAAMLPAAYRGVYA